MERSTQIIVSAPDKQYSITIGAGVLDSLPDQLKQRNLDGRPAIVTNTDLLTLYESRLRSLLPNAAVIAVPEGEAYKTLETVREVYDQFIDAGLDRKAVVIAFGGGVVGDMAGYAAATYLRGVPFVQVPSSLLSMVDSSVGGKVGVDLPQGKNLIGAFKQPEFVLIDSSLLDTLPDSEFRCGTAEVIKAGLIRDPDLLDSDLYRREDKDAVSQFITRAVQIKADVVQADPYEQNIRAFLNLGHTFGHALERITRYQWKHGEAVGFGLAAAIRLSVSYGVCDPALIDTVESVLTQVGLPIRYPANDPVYDVEGWYAAMGTDKKRAAGKIRFVLIRAPGDPFIADDVPRAMVIEVLEAMRQIRAYAESEAES